jgi:hypothetical protein
MDNIKNIIEAIKDFDLNNNWVRYSFYFLSATVVFFVAMALGGDIIYWKILAKLKILEIKKLFKKPGFILPNNSEDYQEENLAFSDSPGNFLSIYSSLKSSLQTIAQEMGNDFDKDDRAINFLIKKKILTKSGKKKMKIINWTARMIEDGKIRHIENILMKDAVKLIWNFHREMNLCMQNLIKNRK